MNSTTRDDEKQMIQLQEEEESASIFAAFEKVKDGRKARGKRYSLPLLLTLYTLGKLAGEQSMTGIVEWIKERELWLKKRLNWPKRFPVIATFTQAFAKCDSKEVEQAVMHGIEEALEKRRKRAEAQDNAQDQHKEKELQHVAADGKSLRGTRQHQAENQPPVYLFSLYDCQTGIVLGHVVIDKKTNEIRGIKVFLEDTMIAGRIFTTDAMHTQKEWFAEVYKMNGFVFSTIKKNQKKLYQTVSEFFEKEENNQGKWEYFQQKEKGHGREELREIWVTTQ